MPRAKALAVPADNRKPGLRGNALPPGGHKLQPSRISRNTRAPAVGTAIAATPITKERRFRRPRPAKPVNGGRRPAGPGRKRENQLGDRQEFDAAMAAPTRNRRTAAPACVAGCRRGPGIRPSGGHGRMAIDGRDRRGGRNLPARAHRQVRRSHNRASSGTRPAPPAGAL